MLDNIFKVNVSDNVNILCNKGRYGLVDDNGNEILACQYNYISSPNSYGLCLLEDCDGDYGFCNLRGEIIIPTCFDSVGMFVKGLCVVESEGEFGVCNTDGEMVIPAIYDQVNFNLKFNYVSVRKDYLWGAYGEDGVEMFDVIYTRAEDVEKLFVKEKL